MRAYCGHCYPAAAEGDYHAGGDGLLLDYAGFARRFGAPGPPPPPSTAVDRLLTALLRDPALRLLSPASEAIARRRRQVPYPVRAAFMIEGGIREALATVATAGQLIALVGHPAACARVKALVEGR